MNHPFIKMLKFELKLNYKKWIISLLISISFLFIVYSPIRQGMSFNPVFFSFCYVYPHGYLQSNPIKNHLRVKPCKDIT